MRAIEKLFKKKENAPDHHHPPLRMVMMVRRSPIRRDCLSERGRQTNLQTDDQRDPKQTFRTTARPYGQDGQEGTATTPFQVGGKVGVSGVGVCKTTPPKNKQTGELNS
ncbi:hypothetical protein BXY66_1597 [Shimia isoporae]|uniref:Uncharacterized protein n=1 Tax=Shimia isoporae TaxID=647720 RepID=A0A4R1NMA2_9RHOB|nr:hypothetical protein BXY66_1597 [Shimia isoporae]